MKFNLTVRAGGYSKRTAVCRHGEIHANELALLHVSFGC